MKRKTVRRRQQAFTFAEVMVATAVVALGIVGMIQAVVVGSEMLDLARKQTVATQIIHGQLDQIRLRTWAQVDNWGANRTVKVDASEDNGDQTNNVSAGFVFGTNLPALSKNFSCKRTITTVRTDLKQVTYTVTWTSGTGKTYSRSGSTYFGKNGLYVTYQRS
jgi:Tfp pilus assembly protein PilV